MSTSVLTSRPGRAVPSTRRARRHAFRGDIEGMRALAVGLVVAFHAGVPFLSGGFVGVDVFFVLSGFLITGLLVDELARTGGISLRDFYARRVRRLLPLAVLVVVGTAAASSVLLAPVDRAGVYTHLVAATLSVANWVFAAESTQYMASTGQSPVLHFWSLNVEEQFYLLWPLLLLLVAGRSGLARRAWPVVFRRIVLVLALVMAVSLALSWQQTASGSTFAYFGLHTRAWELGVGAGLAMLRPVLPLLTRRAAHLFWATGLLLVIGSALLMDEATPFPGTAALLPVLGSALLVAAGSRDQDGLVPRVLGHAVPRYVGRMSYAWYLWHWPVLVLVNARWGTVPGLGPDDAAPRVGPLATAAAVLLSFGLAVASHYAVEQPLRRARRLQASRVRTFALGAGLVAVAVVSSSAMALSGGSGGAAQARAAQAASDEPRQQSRELEGCYNDYETVTVPAAAACRLGPAHGKRSIVLIGDSHSQHWMPAMERLASERGWTVYTFAKSACDVVDVPIWLSAENREYESCARWRESMVKRLATMHVDAVVIGRFMDYRDLVLREDGSRVPRTGAEAAWRSGATATFARLKGVAPRILVIRDTPRPDGNVPRCLSQHADDPDRCTFDRATHTDLDAPLARAEQAADPRRVRLVDLTSTLCPDETCPVVDKGVVMYRDSHHLTAKYAATLADPLGDAIEAPLR